MTIHHSTKTVIFTLDIVLSEILNRLLKKSEPNSELLIYSSFSDANKVHNNDGITFIMVDDAIIGASSYELISYLRLNRKANCPIIYFGVNEHDSQKKAISIGANHFVNKPFKPEDIIELFQALLYNQK
ncbi:MAG: response regulator [Bacteroidales bacterium]|nr:response regulator [Bacteroidales bacterium]MBN2750519.1 response regulator [Bacteroidales bacterium]